MKKFQNGSGRIKVCFQKTGLAAAWQRERKALLRHCLKPTVLALRAATKTFLKVGTSTECRSGITMPAICIDPFASNNNLRRGAK